MTALPATRTLLVVADDLGIGPETSRGIVELACRGVVTGAALLANSPHAADGARRWRAARPPADLGWHACLTLDRPVRPAADVPSLVGPGGRFYGLGGFLARLLIGAIKREHVERELTAQLGRFRELTGQDPAFVNSHQHVARFGGVGRMLRALAPGGTFVRTVREPWRTLRRVPGARLKRLVLSVWPGGDARAGADWLIGVADPAGPEDPSFFDRWLAAAPGEAVELMCHPGHPDGTLLGRPGEPGLASVRRRAAEYGLLSGPAFAAAWARAGFSLRRPAEWMATRAVRRQAG